MANPASGYTDFVDIPIETDSSALADDAIEYLRSQWPDWEPNDADMEVIQIEALAPMAADAAAAASQMPAAALRAYGTNILGIAYNAGVPASTEITIVCADTAGHTVGAGAQVEIDGYAFALAADAVVPSGSSQAAGQTVNAVDPGTDANGLTGAVAVSINLPGFVDHFVVENTTSGGVDPDDDAAFTDRVSRELRLRSKTYITATDFVLAALDTPGIGYAVANGNTARQVSVGLADSGGNPVTSAVKSAYSSDVSGNRLVNLTVTLYDPTYTTVSVTYTAKALPGYDTADLLSRINSLLDLVLSPSGYLNPQAGQGPNMRTDTTIWPNWLIGVISSVIGVDYVESLSIAGAAANGSLALAGNFPLPQAGVMTGTIVTT